MIHWQEFIAIAVEAILALVATFYSVRQTVQRLKTTRDYSSLNSLILLVPRAVLIAEWLFGSGHGHEKREYALLILQKYADSLDIDFHKVEQTCRDAIEDVLQTPQKKLEDILYETQKDD